MPKRPSTPSRATEALESLVNQFSNPLSFYRELIQNSLDAGSEEIDVRLEFQEEEGSGKGVLVIHVDDYGEGMNRHIIDTLLTRLFSSSKDEDLTKIGRFGIGFVSVFAIEPEAVIVDTSRDGENWRVLFEKDKSFTRIERDEPVEGTKIRIVKQVTPEEYENFERRSREILTYWCKHVEAEIRFQGEPINQPLDLDVPCKVRHRQEGTEVVVGYALEKEGMAGFYNRGLTLYEGQAPILADVITYKINSRYLEHTLTRDNVLRDKNFEKVLAIVERLALEALPKKLFSMIDASVRSGQQPESVLYKHVAGCFRRDRYMEYWSLRKIRSAIRKGALFLSVKGKSIRLDECRRAGRRKRLYIDHKDSALISRMEEEGFCVIQAGRRGAAAGHPRAALDAILEYVPKRANRTFCFPLPAPLGKEREGWSSLKAALLHLLDDLGVRIRGVSLARFAYPGSFIARRVAITQGEEGKMTPVDEIQYFGRSLFSGRRVLTVNADHPAVKRLVAMSDREPELAAYLLVKFFFLRGTLKPDFDSRLAAASWGRRCQRLTV